MRFVVLRRKRRLSAENGFVAVSMTLALIGAQKTRGHLRDHGSIGF
jgi:hypothetical protein